MQTHQTVVWDGKKRLSERLECMQIVVESKRFSRCCFFVWFSIVFLSHQAINWDHHHILCTASVRDAVARVWLIVSSFFSMLSSRSRRWSPQLRTVLLFFLCWWEKKDVHDVKVIVCWLQQQQPDIVVFYSFRFALPSIEADSDHLITSRRSIATLILEYIEKRRSGEEETCKMGEILFYSIINSMKRSRRRFISTQTYAQLDAV